MHICLVKSAGIPYYKYPETITNPGLSVGLPQRLLLVFAHTWSCCLCNNSKAQREEQAAFKSQAACFLADLPAILFF